MGEVDLSALANSMLEWEKRKCALDELEESIKERVMFIKKTQNVGNVRASYSRGRRSYDYQAAADGVVSNVMIGSFTTTTKVTRTDWRGICRYAGIEAPYTQGDPSVSLKLLEG